MCSNDLIWEATGGHLFVGKFCYASHTSGRSFKFRIKNLLDTPKSKNASQGARIWKVNRNFLLARSLEKPHDGIERRGT